MYSDGSGIDIITTRQDPVAGSVSTMVSTQPNTSWSDAKCQSSDRTWDPDHFDRINTTYSFSDITNIDRVCTYINGRWLKFPFDSLTTTRLSGFWNQFDDTGYPYSVIGEVPPSPNDGPKRIFCMHVIYKVDFFNFAYECSVGWSQVRFLVTFDQFEL